MFQCRERPKCDSDMWQVKFLLAHIVVKFQCRERLKWDSDQGIVVVLGILAGIVVLTGFQCRERLWPDSDGACGSGMPVRTLSTGFNAAYGFSMIQTTRDIDGCTAITYFPFQCRERLESDSETKAMVLSMNDAIFNGFQCRVRLWSDSDEGPRSTSLRTRRAGSSLWSSQPLPGSHTTNLFSW